MLRTHTRFMAATAVLVLTTLGLGIAIGWRAGVENKPKACQTFKHATPISSVDNGTKQICTFASVYGRATFSVDL